MLPAFARCAATALTAALTAALLAACGGGAESESASPSTLSVPASPEARAQAAASALANQGARRAVLAAAPAGLLVTDPQAAAQQLFDFAETAFPAFFPRGAATQALAPFVFRHYPATGVYLGVVLDDGGGYVPGGVYVMGGAFGQAPVHVGALTDFVQPTGPGARVLLSAGDKLPVVTGSHATLRVTVERLQGFNGPLQLALSGLPAGVTASPVVVPAGATSADITVVAAGEAPHSLPTTAQLRVAASFGARQVSATGTLTVTVRGLPGAVDASFGGGVLLTPVANSEDYAHAVAVQADGKVITAGTTAISTGTVVALTRHLRDGGLDPSFGNQGRVITQVGARGDSARAVTVQADGKIIVAGWTDATGTDANLLVLRYRADGSLDAGFGDAGRVILPVAPGTGTDRAYAVAVQNDGRIVVGGTTQSGAGATGQDFALVRLMPDGQPDAGFGQGGTVVTAMQSNSGGDIVYALALPVVDGQQRILAVGGEGDFMAARYLPNGSLDGSFGVGGKVVGMFRSNVGAARAVAMLPDGRMVLGGGVLNDFAAAQLTVSGTLDASFGEGGLVRVAVSGGNWDNATGLARQADGKLVLGGWAYRINATADFAALRLLPSGALDTTFGEAGIAVRPLGAGTRNDSARGLVLQVDDRVPTVRAILAGEVSVTNNDFGLLRLWL
jgi:uncharacterized delta-60 repeat protein